MKKKTFKRLGAIAGMAGIILLSNTPVSFAAPVAGSTASSADSPTVRPVVTSQSKNAKVVTDKKTVQNETKTRVLQEEQWEQARSGESILALPVLNQVINEWLLDKGRKIEIQYPGGEEGEFWVQQLADWLVSLGIPTDAMIIIPGSGADDIIKFNIIK
jgi:hypothetical protein